MQQELTTAVAEAPAVESVATLVFGMDPVIASLVIAVASLIIAVYLMSWLNKLPSDIPAMQRIADAIKQGANAFLARQYKTIAYLSIGLGILIYVLYAYGADNPEFGKQTAIAFLFGAACSSLAGYVGMYVSVRANLKTAVAATSDLNSALLAALRGGAVSGIFVVAMSLLGISAMFLVYERMGVPLDHIPHLLVGYGFGASFVALFAQVGGGIFTKAADVGADLVGKIEAGIPEDDARNPAVIADLVGDNVGDCAGRGADLFESTAAENIGAMILGILLYPVFGIDGILFPLVVRAFGLIASIIGVFLVKARPGEDAMKALNRGYYITSILAAVAFYYCTDLLLDKQIEFFYAGLVGIALSLIFLFITQYYTESKYRPTRDIVQASETGPATNVISGMALGFECTGIPVIAISVALLLSYWLGEKTGIEHGGLYGTAIATMGMLSTAAYVLAMDTFGPIADNAGGIVEMSGTEQSKETRMITDQLDTVGNTTKALTKGYAVGSAALAAFLLFSAYLEEANLTSVDLSKVDVFVGALIGGGLIFVFSALTLRAVGKAAYYIINEVRRQFKEKPGIMAGTELPDYAACVDISTKGALKEMILPGAIAVIVPVIVGITLKAEAAAGMLMVGTITGILVALMMNNAGGAWDNAKKFIESGQFTDSKGQVQGKKTFAHAAAVVGDTVGDPFKDTAGPSLHVLIKLLSTLTLVLAGLFIDKGSL